MCELHVRSCEVQNFFPAEPILLGSDNSVNFLESGGEFELGKHSDSIYIPYRGFFYKKYQNKSYSQHNKI